MAFNIIGSAIKSAFNAVKNMITGSRPPHSTNGKEDMTKRKKRNRKFPVIGRLLWDARSGSYRRSGPRASLLRNNVCKCGSGIKTKRCCGSLV